MGIFGKHNVRAANRRAALKTRLHSARVAAQAVEWEAEDEVRESDGPDRVRAWHAVADRARRRRAELAQRLDRLS